MPLSSATLQALRTLAEQASPSPWHVEGVAADGVVYVCSSDAAYSLEVARCQGFSVQSCQDDRNAIYLANCQPNTILALLDLAALALEVTRLRARIASNRMGSDDDVMGDLLKLIDHASASPGQTGA